MKKRKKSKKAKEGFYIMRKFVSAALVLAMSVTCLAGCGNKAADGGAASADTPITVLSREDGSGTRGAFIELFGIEEEGADGNKVDMTTTEASITNSTSVMMSSVANDTSAIGYISLGSLNDTVKAVKIDGAEASAENVENGTYSIVRPFNIVLKDGSSNPVATDFINYIMSADGQTVVTDNGYIPVGDQAAFTTDGSEGKVVVGGSSSVSPVMEKLAESYMEANPKAEIELQTTDSTTGVSSTVEGTYDIGMASRGLKDEEASQGVTSTVIAQDGIAVIVNNDSTVDELSSDQVKGIFTGETTTWGDITTAE